MPKRVLAPILPTQNKEVKLPEGEAHHLLQVFRLGDGDTVEAMDGKGGRVLAKLRVRNKEVFLGFVQNIEGSSTADAQAAKFPLDLEMAVLKGDAMEWVIEKAVELGVRTFYPLLTAHTVVQIDKKGPEAFQTRWQKIADQAIKQCGRPEFMHVAPPRSIADHFADDAKASKSAPFLRWICDESDRESLPHLAESFRDQIRKDSQIRVLIGPEGGFSAKEKELFQKSLPQATTHRVSLGPWVLRAETAALFSVSIASAHFTLAALSHDTRGT